VNIRQWNKDNWQFDKVSIGEVRGFNRYIILSTVNKYAWATAPIGSTYTETDLGIGTMLAVEKDGIWIAWNPGWGVDIHYPTDNAPEYLRGGSPNDCNLNGGKCFSDGSSLADGEKFYPAFNRGGAEAVFALLEEWWRPSDEQ